MYDYLMHELPKLIEETFPVSGQRSIFLVFLVWHGALVLALRGPKRYNSFPAFSPTCNPATVLGGEGVFRPFGRGSQNL
ncbi:MULTISPECIES: alpha/beta hydrolase-fold protein [unclassified Sulfitobacter]|uniref:alpha/beta hydrolase-fold protein n=1 Tax=unclassified Sulfitobacter TaxID=196795 RepID=UPI003744E4AC